MSLPKIGIEFEVAEFRTGYGRFVRKFVNRGWMHETFTGGWHNYNCRCKTCKHEFAPVKLLYPPLWIAQYDASLPEDGAELISTPFVPNRVFLDALEPQLDIITNDAVYSPDRVNMRGGDTSIGMHFHVSVGDQLHAATLGGAEEQLYIRRVHSLLTYLSLATYVLASTCGETRSFEYRVLPVYDIYEHHSAIAAVHLSTKYSRLEWRVWEGYPDKDYILAAMLTSAALTEIVTSQKASKLLAWYNIREKDRQVVDVLQSNYENVIDCVDEEELDLLLQLMSFTRTAKSACHLWYTVEEMFENAKEVVACKD